MRVCSSQHVYRGKPGLFHKCLGHHTASPITLHLRWGSCSPGFPDAPLTMAFRAVFPSAKGIPLYSGGRGGPVFTEFVQTWLAGLPLPCCHIWLKLVTKVKNILQRGAERRVPGCRRAFAGAGGHQARGIRQQQQPRVRAESSSHLVLHPGTVQPN